MDKLLIAFFAILPLISGYTVDDYCKISKENVVCVQNGQCGAKAKCQTTLNPGPLTNEERQYILNLHNDLRQKQASGAEENNPLKASNMHVLGYSLELEHMAQCWANNCEQKFHDNGRGSPNYPHQGQNMFAIWWYSPVTDNISNLDYAVNRSWFGEVKYFKGGNHFDDNSDVNRYTQVIWAETKLIGCAKIFHENGQKLIVICNYYPSGNVLNTNIFEIGEPCSGCGNEMCNDNYKELCGNTYPFPVDPEFKFCV